MTDNINRTVSDVRHAFVKSGGNLGTNGSVAYLFDKKGVISYDIGTDEDQVMEAALDAGAEDVITNDDGSLDVYTPVEDFDSVLAALDATGLEAVEAEVTMVPSTKAELDATTAPKFLRLIDMLEELDDTQEVFSNADISDDILANLE
jgi:YebC/PmpR family DNA-binding regulatory protein